MNSHSSDESNPTREQKELLQKLHASTLTEAEFARLNVLLSDDPDFRWNFIHDVHLRVGLRSWAKSHGVASQESLSQLLDAAKLRRVEAAIFDPDDLRDDGGKLGMTWATRIGQYPIAIAIAAVGLILALGVLRYAGTEVDNSGDSANSAGSMSIGMAQPGHDQFALSDSRSVVARVVWATDETRWSSGNQPSDFLMRLRPGDVIGIDSGLVKIEFSDGALVLLQSSSLLQVTSSTSARLIRGQVAGRALNGNFTLSTPTATVVDIGTEFGVGVNDKGTAVTVFEGEVHVHGMLSSTTSGPLRRLTEGMSLTIDSDGTTKDQSTNPDYRREFFQLPPSSEEPNTISLLDLIGGYTGPQPSLAGSIDPQTGYWGRLPWTDPGAAQERRGDTQYTSTTWNEMVDGVFIPRSNAREMQIDSDGHMVYLPPNSGATWGPIWARRRSDLDGSHEFSRNQKDTWGNGSLEDVLHCLSQSDAGIMGLHANVGITFDLDAVRSATGNNVESLEAGIANFSAAASGNESDSQVDLRVFVDGKLRYSRIAFSPHDGEEAMSVSIEESDRFVTIVTIDAGGDGLLDHAVLIDPVFRF